VWLVHDISTRFWSEWWFFLLVRPVRQGFSHKLWAYSLIKYVLWHYWRNRCYWQFSFLIFIVRLMKCNQIVKCLKWHGPSPFGCPSCLEYHLGALILLKTLALHKPFTYLLTVAVRALCGESSDKLWRIVRGCSGYLLMQALPGTSCSDQTCLVTDKRHMRRRVSADDEANQRCSRASEFIVRWSSLLR